jgi:hypothetical protein
VALTIGTQQFSLKDVVINPRASAIREGVIGADVFRQGSRGMLDFETMTLTATK